MSNGYELLLKYTVIDQDTKLDAVLSNQLTEVLHSGADSLATKIEYLSTEEGYINGCSGSFVIAKIEVPETPPSYMCLYRLHIDESIYETEYDILIGCMTQTFSTQSLADLQELTHLTVGTLRYDAERDEKLKKS